jgi:hypothetical protein
MTNHRTGRVIVAARGWLHLSTYLRQVATAGVVAALSLLSAMSPRQQQKVLPCNTLVLTVADGT